MRILKCWPQFVEVVSHMKICKTIWSGCVTNLPLQINVSQSIDEVDLEIYPIGSLKYGLKLLSEFGAQVQPCSSCLASKVTDSISYNRLELLGRGNKLTILCNILIVCNGVNRHALGERFSMVLHIEN